MTLSGAVSDLENDALVYLWTQVANGAPMVTLVDEDEVDATFTAPQALPPNSQLVFSLAVSPDLRRVFSRMDNDGDLDVVADAVTITVNNAPIVNVTDQDVDEEDTVTLSATDSTDPEGTALRYSWAQVADGAPMMTLINAMTVDATFMTPNLLVNTDLRFSLTVTDENGLANISTVTVTVMADNDAPTANAGEAKTIARDDTYTFDGSGTDPEEQTLSYLWTVPTRAAGLMPVVLSDVNIANPALVSPTDVLVDEDLEFILIVGDGTMMVTDTVIITIQAGAVGAPIADAGDNQMVNEGNTVTLDGSASSSIVELSYSWTLQAGAPVTVDTSGFTNARPVFVVPRTATSNFQLVFTLRVSDILSQVATDTVIISVRATNESSVIKCGTRSNREWG